jgi:acyl dehydratase
VTIDPGIEGFEYEPVSARYGARETILYALGVGAGARDDELRFVYETGLQALPTFPVAPPFAALMSMEDVLGIDLATVLHGEQRLRLHRPVPAGGQLDIRAHISKVWDKGAGAVIDTTADVVVDGEIVATTTYASFVRGGGGFGGERGSGLRPPAVDRPPDAVATETTLDRQAQVYRLAGDTNPLHVDPAFARAAGFERPILHGLCTYGFAARMAMHLVAGGRPESVTGVDARFTDVVYPGDALTVELWRIDPQRTYGRVSVVARDAVVIDPLEISTTPQDVVTTVA